LLPLVKDVPPLTLFPTIMLAFSKATPAVAKLDPGQSIL